MMVLPIIRARRGLLSATNPFEFSFVEGVNASSTTFSMNFGPADEGRVLFLLLDVSNSSGFPVGATPSVTIGGVAATRILPVASGGATHQLIICNAAVPTGNSGNIVVANGNRFSAAIYRSVGLSSAVPYDTASGLDNLSVDIPAGGFALALFGRIGNNPITLTGIDTDFNGLSGLHDCAMGSKISVAGETIIVDSPEAGTAGHVASFL